eukprot:s8759_g1.t1
MTILDLAVLINGDDIPFPTCLQEVLDQVCAIVRLIDIPAKSLEGVQIHYLKTVDEALDWVFGSAEAPVNLDLATSSRSSPGRVIVACPPQVVKGDTLLGAWATRGHTPDNELSDNANDEHEVEALAAGSKLLPHLPTRRSTAMYPAQTCLRLAASSHLTSSCRIPECGCTRMPGHTFLRNFVLKKTSKVATLSFSACVVGAAHLTALVL